MVRPCFLVIDPAFPGSISTRKLVLETAKFNVLTAYSAKEAVETLRLFPNLHGAVLDTDVDDIPCEMLAKALKEIKPTLSIVAISRPGEDHCPSADQHIESFDPRKLLDMLQKLVPEETAAIEKREEDLSREKK